MSAEPWRYPRPVGGYDRKYQKEVNRLAPLVTSGKVKCKITVECVLTDGTRLTHDAVCTSSTDVARNFCLHQLGTQEAVREAEKKLWLTRIFHEGNLVREFDWIAGRYTLTLD